MDVNEEAMTAHKRAFLDFLDQDVGKGVYMQAVRDMVQNKRHRLIIGMDELRNHNLDLARRSAPAWTETTTCAGNFQALPLPNRQASGPPKRKTRASTKAAQSKSRKKTKK